MSAKAWSNETGMLPDASSVSFALIMSSLRSETSPKHAPQTRITSNDERMIGRWSQATRWGSGQFERQQQTHSKRVRRESVKSLFKRCSWDGVLGQARKGWRTYLQKEVALVVHRLWGHWSSAQRSDVTAAQSESSDGKQICNLDDWWNVTNWWMSSVFGGEFYFFAIFQRFLYNQEARYGKIKSIKENQIINTFQMNRNAIRNVIQ